MSVGESIVKIESNQENRRLFLERDKCDKYDYLAAIACGAVGGLIDIFLVGTPGNSVLGKWTDAQTDKAVMSFAKLTGWNPRKGNSNNPASAIGFLENKFRVNYDQRYTSDVNGAFDMSTKNHHMKSLAHSPDVAGLFFSVLAQFTSTSAFIAGGRLITVRTDTFELQGGNFIAKLFCGVANWFGHIMSDIAGSSGARGNTGRGSGVVMPFYEFFGLCKFGSFDVNGTKKDLAQLAEAAFECGYDFRFGAAQAIPVIVTELSIRLIWALRRRYQMGYSIRECIPTQAHDSLRIMLICGDGTLCFMDGADALIKSHGNALVFFMHLNLVAWYRLVTLVLKEIFIRVGLRDSVQETLDAFIVVNEELSYQLCQLKKLDVRLFESETRKYEDLLVIFKYAKTTDELISMLNNAYDKLEINKPWQGDFNKFMSDKNSTMVFE